MSFLTTTTVLACDRKRKMTRGHAKRVLAHYLRQGAQRGSVNAYPCLFDPTHWHVGHIPGWSKRPGGRS